MKSSPILFSIRAVIAATLALVLTCPAPAQTAAPASPDQDHIVSSQDLQQQVQSSSADRQKNIDSINQLLSMPQAERAMHDSHVDAKQVRAGVPTLSDKELSDLGARSRQAQHDFAAGSLSGTALTLLILVIIVVIIVAIVH